MGCWNDMEGDFAVPFKQEQICSHLTGNFNNMNDREYAIQECFQCARDGNFGLFALQTGGRCFTGDAYLNYKRYGRATVCPGNGRGDIRVNAVYLLTAYKNPSMRILRNYLK